MIRSTHQMGFHRRCQIAKPQHKIMAAFLTLKEVPPPMKIFSLMVKMKNKCKDNKTSSRILPNRSLILQQSLNLAVRPKQGRSCSRTWPQTRPTQYCTLQGPPVHRLRAKYFQSIETSWISHRAMNMLKFLLTRMIWMEENHNSKFRCSMLRVQMRLSKLWGKC